MMLRNVQGDAKISWTISSREDVHPVSPNTSHPCAAHVAPVDERLDFLARALGQREEESNQNFIIL